jgi:hypothetical protein
LIFSFAALLLVRVTFIGPPTVFTSWPGKATDDGDTVTDPTPVPVPLSATVSVGLTGSLLLMVIKATRAPEAAGVKVTLRLQLAPAVRVVPQLPDCAKSAALLPPSVMPVMVNVALPVLDNVTVWDVLEVLMG